MLESLSSDLWHVRQTVKMLGASMPVRMFVCRYGDGQLCVYSPVDLCADLAAQISALGTVDLIIAPSRYHNLFVDNCRTCFPEAELLVSPSLQEKFETTTMALPMERSGLKVRLVRGAPKFSEIVVFHEASKSLIVADLIFNLEKPKGMLKIITWMSGTTKGPAQSRFWGRVIKDKAAYSESLKDITRWPFTRVEMCHGKGFDCDPNELMSHLRYQTLEKED